MLAVNPIKIVTSNLPSHHLAIKLTPLPITLYPPTIKHHPKKPTLPIPIQLLIILASTYTLPVE
jgi:hypothetical protein